MRPIIGANWKMNGGGIEGLGYLDTLKRERVENEPVDIVLFPPFTLLPVLAESAREAGISLGGQNIYWKESGAYTGEISSSMLKEAGCSWVIIGHSERRHILHEDNEIIRLKLETSLRSDLKVILCVGELLRDREQDQAEDVVKAQIQHALDGLKEANPTNMVIAYEPVWAIGTGRNATPEEANRMHGLVRCWISDIMGENDANKIRIQYGGSVKPGNAPELLAQEQVNGALVGGASLDANQFIQIIRAIPK